MTVCLLSLGGLPPTAGFIGKWYIFSAAVSAGYYGLAIIGVLTSVVSVFFYLRVVVMMYMADRDGAPLPPRITRPGHGCAGARRVDRRDLLSRHPADAGARPRRRSRSRRSSDRPCVSRMVTSAARHPGERRARDLAYLRLPPAEASQMESCVSESADIERELTSSKRELKRLEAEYNMFFAGRLPRPPWEIAAPRRRRWSSSSIRERRSPTTGIASGSPRCSRASRRSIDLWDRGLRARKRDVRVRSRSRGRPSEPKPDRPRIASCTSRRSPIRCARWRRCTSSTRSSPRRDERRDRRTIPFHKFAELVKTQVSALKEKGSKEVAFRVAVKDGKVALTARGVSDGTGPKQVVEPGREMNWRRSGGMSPGAEDGAGQVVQWF